ncbi:MAG: alpha/beta fold hydrolase [Gammaproteobacteria bacterium]|nr:alpha/beta fold hydrolase [Gammaproteobacteria bacterium]
MFIYLHGFNSSGASAKGRFFSQTLAPDAVHTPTYPPAPAAAIAGLQRYLARLLDTAQEHGPAILIGSSLGGFYAQYLARRYQLAAVLINPALQPEQTLTPYLGWQTNYYSGERYYFGKDELTQLRRYAIAEPCLAPVPTLVLLDAADEIIDYRDAEQRYRDCAQVIVYPGGDHQFQHLTEATTAIRAFTGKILASQN